MNDVMVEDTGPESSPIKLLSEPNGDASSVDGSQETDNSKIYCKKHIGPILRLHKYLECDKTPIILCKIQ
jgi:hypothetical protein